MFAISWVFIFNLSPFLYFFSYPSSSGIASRVMSVYTVMCHSGLAQSCYSLKSRQCLRLLSRLELRTLSIQFNSIQKCFISSIVVYFDQRLGAAYHKRSSPLCFTTYTFCDVMSQLISLKGGGASDPKNPDIYYWVLPPNGSCSKV